MGFYVIIFVIFLSSFCNSILFKKISYINEKEFLQLNCKQDPVIFGCRYWDHNIEGNRDKLKIVKSNDGQGMRQLAIDIGRTPRGLSLYFMGIGSTVDTNDARFNATGWFEKSKTNICYVAYPYEKKKTNLALLTLHMGSMLKSRRPEFVASESRKFLEDILHECRESKVDGCLKSMKQVTAVGWSLGAHIAAYFCRYVRDAWREWVAFLLGLDPAAISVWLKKTSYIRSGDAVYVQIIHTINIVNSIGFIGTHEKTGDTDIIVSSNCPFWMIYSEHKLCTYMHDVTAAQTHFMVASKNGTDRVLDKSQIDKTSEQFEKHLTSNECLVGVYNKNHCGKTGGQFKIYVRGPACSLFSSFDVSHA